MTGSRRAIWVDLPCPKAKLLYLMAVAGILALQAGALLAMGRPLICLCGTLEFWHANPSGPQTSQHFTDWYTFTHLHHGFGLYLLLWLIAPRMGFWPRLILAVGLEAGWEIFENTPFVIERYRQSALAEGYYGDSVINSLCDTLAAGIGFMLARILPLWLSITLISVLEVFLAYSIRDNFTLNIVQLIYPNDLLSNWQTVK